MKNSILLTLFGIAVIVAVPASATTSTTFVFTSTTGENGTPNLDHYSNTSPLSYTVNGINVTATAYVTTGLNSTTSTVTNAAEVGQYSGAGLGVCSVGDPGYSSSSPSGCTQPSHQDDNQSNYEFILFTFSAPVDLSSITLGNFGGVLDTYSNGQYTSSLSTTSGVGAMDLNYWTGTSAASTSLSDISNLGSGWSSETTVNCGGDAYSGGGSNNGGLSGCGTSVTDSGLTGSSVKYLLVGSGYNNTTVDSYFKVQDLVVTAAPEPATFGLIGLSLAGLAMLRRKRKV